MSTAHLVSTARTPIGGFLGSLSSLTAPKLGAHAIRAAVARAGVAPDAIEQVIMGNVVSAGLGQAPARQAGLGAGLPTSHAALTVNKVCGSGLMAVALAAQAIRLDEADVIAAGGMESMSNAPYLLPRVRKGLRMGNGRVLDAMIVDGLWDPYDDFHMGTAAESCARSRDVTRAAQDTFAVESYRRAQAATAAGAFRTRSRRSRSRASAARWWSTRTKEPARIDFDRVGTLKPAFERDGITAANASTTPTAPPRWSSRARPPAHATGSGRARAWSRPRPPGARPPSSRSRRSTPSAACSTARS
jgi:acetyl-CoA C-acetyltransferase